VRYGLTSVVIPSVNGLMLLRRCVASIRRHTDPEKTPYEIIVVDDGSADATAEWCADERLKFVRLPETAGFPRACNKGMRMASGEQILLLNNDTMATPRWLDNLLDALHGSDEIGAVGPVSNCAGGRQRIDLAFGGPDEFIGIAGRMNVPDPAKREPALRLVGFCLLLKRAVYERVGGLDERFSPGHYEDDDYCFRIRMHGFGLRICRDTLVWHEGSASFRLGGEAAQQALIARNRELFIAKWQADPAWFH
jgi:GT2 family glycosyltransferase